MLLLDFDDDTLTSIAAMAGLRSLVRFGASCKTLHRVVARELQRRIGQDPCGELLLERLAHDKNEGATLYASGGGPDAESTAMMQHDIRMRMPGYCPSYFPGEYRVHGTWFITSSSCWSQFLFTQRVEYVAGSESRCARAIHEFNKWMRGATRFVRNIFRPGSGFAGAFPPDSDFYRICGDVAIYRLKRCLLQNEILRHVVGWDVANDPLKPSSVVQQVDVDAAIEFESMKFEWEEPCSDWVAFLEAYGTLEIDQKVESLVALDGYCTSRTNALRDAEGDAERTSFILSLPETASISSWILWAVYGCKHGGLLDALFQVLLGRANLDSLVPGRMKVWEDADVMPAQDRYRPLRQWLREHKRWLSDPVVQIFYLAAGETYDADAMAEHSDDDDDSEDGDDSEEEDHEGDEEEDAEDGEEDDEEEEEKEE